MSDDRDPSASDEKTSAGVSDPGSLLKHEREKQGLSLQRIATDMHLSTVAVEAMEANRFAVLGARVFAKGHLRKYASLLGISADRVAELYDGLDDAPRQVDPIPFSQRTPEPALRPAIRQMAGVGSDDRQQSAGIGSWIAVAISIAVVLIGVGWWYWGHRAPLRENPTAVVKPPEVAAPTDRAPDPGATSNRVAAAVETPSGPAPGVQSNPAPAPRPTQSAGTPPPGKMRVRLTFTRDSWVEVYDVGGNRMFYDVGRVDMPRLIDVEPPVLVKLGDASAVITEANDRKLTIPAKNISGTVARFTIAADGSVK